MLSSAECLEFSTPLQLVLINIIKLMLPSSPTMGLTATCFDCAIRNLNHYQLLSVPRIWHERGKSCAHNLDLCHSPWRLSLMQETYLCSIVNEDNVCHVCHRERKRERERVCVSARACRSEWMCANHFGLIKPFDHWYLQSSKDANH